ncbi:hypothetical protein [Caulobacter segnis]
MANDLSSLTPRLTPARVAPERLQAAVDAFDPAAVDGIEFEGYETKVVGVDIRPGIVVEQAKDRLEAAANIYLDLKAGRTRSSGSVRATVEFHLVGDDIIIDKITAAQRAA